MKIKLSFIVILICNCFTTMCQGSFDLLISTLKDERVFDASESENGNYFIVGKKFTITPWEESSYFLVINNFGDKIYEQEYSISDTLSYFGNVYYKNDSIFIFGAKGPMTVGLPNRLWLLILDSDYNILKDKSFYLSGYNLLDIESIINANGNFVLTGVISYPSELPDMLIYEISSSGDSVNMSVLAFDGGQFEYDIIEIDTGGYKVFAYGDFPGAPQTNGKIVLIDESFNFISADSIPYSLYHNNSAKWISNSSYLITGKKHMINPTKNDLGIVKVNSNDEIIQVNHFGKTSDTNHHVGACSNLDFISTDNIYFGGSANIFDDHLIYQPEDSWIILNNIDSNLNLNWQKYYGGDAFYYLWGLKATQDGGCLMMATRYDADIQDDELDIYILKVDSAGLLTSTGEGPHIPVQQLAIVPNPAWDIVSIRYPDIFGFGDKEIEVYNSQGLPVIFLSATQDLTETRVDISALPIGLYFVVLKVEGKKVGTGKMVKI